MKRRGWIITGALLALPLAAVLAAAALLATERGLLFALHAAQRVAPGELAWERATGRLIGPLTLEGVSYQDDVGTYRIGRFDFDWSPGRLLARRLSVHRLHLDDTEVVLAEPAEESPAAPIEPGWSLPLEIVLRDVQVRNLRVHSGAGAPVVIGEFNTALSSGLEWVDIEQLALRLDALELAVQGRLGLGRQVATDLALEWRAAPPGYAPLAGAGTLSGTWERLQLAQRLSAPVAAQAQLDLRLPFAELQWALELALPVFTLTQLHPDWPAQQAGGTLKAAGTLAGGELAADLETDWSAQTLYPLRVELHLARGDDGSVQVQPLTLQHGDGRLRLAGSWLPVAERFTARLDAQQFRWPPVGAAQWRLPQGELQANGTLQDYLLTLSARLEGADLPPADIQAEGRGSLEALRLDHLRIAALDGVVSGQGELAWAPQLRWDAQLSAENLDPGRHWPDWPGRLSARAHSSGTVGEQGPDLMARIEALAGELRGYPVGGAGVFALHGDTARIERIELRSGDARLEADGSVGTQWALDWRLQAPRLEHLLPGYAGAIDASGSLTGARAQPRLQARAQARDVAASALRLGGLQVDADLSLRAGAPLRLTANGTALRVAERGFDTLALDLGGTLDAHALSVQAQGPTQAVDIAARGGWDGSAWTGRLERGDWRLPEAGAWTLDAPAALALGAQRGRIEELCWRQDAARLCAQFDDDGRERRLQTRLSDWPVTAAAATYLPPGVSLAAQLDADVDARLPAQGAAQATARLRLSPGALDWTESGQARRTGFDGGDATLALDAAGARAQAELRLNGSDRLGLEASLPGYRPGVAPSEQRLAGRLDGTVQDLALLDGLLDAVDQLAGTVQLEAALGGTLAAPALDGALRLADGRAFIGPAGVQLEEIQLALSGDPTAGRLNLSGAARSGPGTVRLDGWLTRLGSPDLEGELRIGGEAFEAVNLPEARVLVTPDLRAAVRARAVAFDGSVHIPEARIAPRDLSGAVAPSKDVVLVEQEAAPPPGWEVTSRVQLSLGEQVHFDGYGLKGRLTGGIEVIDEPGRVTRARGELAVKDGTYQAYGQALTIEQGRVLYRDGPLDNPGLDIRASRRSGDVTAGVRVLGNAQSPQAELYSQPSLPQADQLSYLLLGRPVAGASGGEGQLLMQAATSLGLKGGNLLAQTIGSSFGFDEVSVGGDGNGLDSAALSVGKYLSPRLYLNYSVGLLDAANRLQIRYQLSRHLSVQTETGTETGGDILYTIER
ncbi:MAG: translocation/assembly module TamB domain-containing protein [Gammaproteobacteria bacterium]